jgi:glycosyltransferase involved in cell wall biosynthesis
VIPTRNRASLLKYMLQSLVEQTTQDFEVVVSDNDSTDETASVVKGFVDLPIRYLRTNRCLPIHDNWENGVSHATGDYVLTIGDDDCLVPKALESFARCLGQHPSDFLAYGTATYNWPDSLYAHARGTFLIPPYARLTSLLDARDVLRRRFAFDETPPLTSSCVVSAKLLAAVRNRAGRVWIPPFPEYGLFAAALSQIDAFAYLEWPLVVVGDSSTNVSSQDFVARPGQPWAGDPSARFRYVPLSGFFRTNGVAESHLAAKARFGDAMGGIELDLRVYFIRYYDDVMGAARRGHDVRELADEFFRVLDRQSAGVRADVQAEIKQRRFNLFVRRRFARLPGSQRLKSTLARLVLTSRGFRQFDCVAAGLHTILDCAQRIDELSAV